VVEVNDLAQHSGVAAKVALPESIADNYVPAVDMVFLRTINSSQDRLHPQGVEEVRTDRHAADHDGLVHVREREGEGNESGKVLEGGALVVEVREVRTGYGRAVRGAAGGMLGNRHQSIGMRETQRTQEHRIHHAENRRFGAHAERDRKHYRRRKTGVPAQHAERVAYILGKPLDRSPASHLARHFLDQSEIAERAASRRCGLRAAHPRPHPFLDFHVEIGLQFLVELVVAHVSSPPRS
jgi:hypothetical protein